MQILTVDDDPVFARILKHMLEKAGYDTIQASDGQEALDILRQTDVRMVITDWEMPNVTGVDLVRHLRSDAFDRYVYAILLTSHSEPEYIVDGMLAGADDFISKPFNGAELRVRIKAAERVLSLEMRDMAIFMMAKLAESRDPETGHHLERVQRYSRVLAEELARTAKYANVIDSDYLRLIFQTSPLHDIGKVGTPDHILLKPGRLTPEEFEVMKEHTTHGAQTLDLALQQYPHASFLLMARDIAIAHHEKFDGSGYPRGLVGDEIPLAARIVALADVYDALTSVRVYKDAFSEEKTREVILEGRGKHFDPDVVDAFLRVQARFSEIKRTYKPTLEEVPATC